MKLRDLILESSHKFEYGCVYLSFHILEFPKLQMKIDTNHFYEDPNDDSYGFEKKPHVTLLYGLHKEVTPQQVENIVEKYNTDIPVKFQNLSLFKNDRYEVLKFEAKASNLQQINKDLRKLPHTTDFPEYKPHLTLAYLKPKMGDKYLKLLGNPNLMEYPTGCYYSETSGKITNIYIQ